MGRPDRLGGLVRSNAGIGAGGLRDLHPVAAYSFDAGEGATARDATGHEHDGAIEGPEWTKGKYGSALHFDGINDVVAVPDSSELDLTDEFTLEAWVRPDEANPGSAVITKERGSGLISYQMHDEGVAKGPIAYVENSKGRYSVSAGAAIPVHVWSHLAVTYDGAKLRYYVDGVLEGTASAGDPGVSGDQLLIGDDSHWAAEDAFKGKIDEVRVYDRALDEGEVASDKATPIETPPDPPVAAYSFDADEGTTLEDVTGGGHEGTIEGPEWTKGKYGSALHFDGYKDMVAIPDSNELDLTDEFTLEAWVRPDEANPGSAVITKERGSGLISYQMHAEGLAKTPVAYVENSKGRYLVSASTAIPVHAWSHLAVTYDGAKLRYYVDGVLEGTASAGDPGVSADQLLIGDDIHWAEEDGFKGKIDEVRIYDRALDAGEINSDKATPIETPPDRPVAAYSFDAGEGTVAEDISGGHEGTLEGPVAWTKGRFGDALKFGGSEHECVRIADSPDLRLSEELTLEAWVRPEGGDTSDPIIFKETGGNSTYALGAGLFHASTPEGAIAYEPNISHQVESPTNLTQNVWSHVALTYDGAKLRLYINGALVDSETSAKAIQTKDPLAIGCSHSWEEGMTGKIDEVRIYDRALDEGEIDADKATPIQTPPTPPVAAYSFDAGEGTVAEDLSGEHEGTIEGPAWTKGKFGSALQFNGVEGEQVTVPDSNDLDLTDELTLEAWVRPTEAIEWSSIVTKKRGSGISYQLVAHADHNAPVGYLADAEKEWGVDGGTTPLPANTWSHIAFTSDGAQLRFYVNGKLKGTSSMLVAAEPSTGPLVIGGDTFKGKIDEVRIYDRALDEGEINADKATPIPARPTLTTGAAEGVTANEAVLTGTLDSHGTETSYRFEYGPTTAYGSVVPEAEEETVDRDENQVAEEAVAFLEPNTTYHYRLVGSNSSGTFRGEDKTFTTLASEVSPAQEAEEREEEVAFTGKFKSAPAGFVNLNWSGFPDPKEWTKIEESGVHFIRIGIEDLTTFRKTSVRKEYDDFFVRAAEIAIRPVFVLGSKHIPAKVSKSEEVKCAKEIVNRYGKNGSLWAEHKALTPVPPPYWQVWNEPNVGVNSLRGPKEGSGKVIPEEFGEFLAQMSHGIGEAESGAKIMVGGLLAVNSNPGESKYSPQEFILKMGHRESYEAVGLHPYVFKAKYKKGVGRPRNPADVENVRKRVRGLIKKFRDAVEKVEGSGEPKKRIWIDELGWPVENPEESGSSKEPTHPPVNKEIQAELIKVTFNTIKSLPDKWAVDKVFYYDLADKPGGVNWAENSGLLDDNKNPRPAWNTFLAEVK
jgi:hypothetical protein